MEGVIAVAMNIARVIAPCSYHFCHCCIGAKEHNPSRKLLEYHR
jgi:hypothetical protein